MPKISFPKLLNRCTRERAHAPTELIVEPRPDLGAGAYAVSVKGQKSPARTIVRTSPRCFAFPK